MSVSAGVRDRRRLRDTLAEVVSIGVGNGLTTLGILMPGHRFDPEPTRCRPAVPRRVEPADGGEVETRGLCFDIEGYFDGRLGMILATPAARAMVEILVPRSPVVLELAESALAEVGNILASAFANAVGELLGEVLLVSPPPGGSRR